MNSQPPLAGTGIDSRWQAAFAAAMVTGLFAAMPARAAMVGITFSPPPALANFTTNGMGTVSPPPLPGTQLVDTTDGFKVTAYTLSYTNPNPAQNNTDITVSWVANEGITAAAVATVDHFNHLDGTVTYSPGFTLVDVSLRTITTATDYDLCALHLGPLPSGTAFNQDLLCGTFSQPAGNDLMLQFMTATFHQAPVTSSSDFFMLDLPSSAQSALAAPVPAAVWLLGSALLGLFGVARARARRIAAG